MDTHNHHLQQMSTFLAVLHNSHHLSYHIQSHGLSTSPAKHKINMKINMLTKIHTIVKYHPMESHRKFLGGGGSQKSKGGCAKKLWGKYGYFRTAHSHADMTLI